jgi:hypothetical protein
MQNNPCQRLKQLFEETYQHKGFSVTNIDYQEICSKNLQVFEAYKKEVRKLLWQWHSDDNFINSLEFDQTGRVQVKADLDLKDLGLKYFPSLIREVEGKLTISGNQFKELDHLEVVDRLDAIGVESLQSLNSLRLVRADIFLEGTSLVEIPELSAVGHGFYAGKLESLQSLPKLKSVGDWLEIKNTEISILPVLRTTGVLLAGFFLESAPLLHTVDGRLDLSVHQFVAENLRKVNGRLIIKNSFLDDFRKSFPVLEQVGKSNFSKRFPTIETNSKQVKKQVERLVEQQQLTVTGDVI